MKNLACITNSLMLTTWSGVGMIEGSGKLGGTVMFKGRSGSQARVKTKGVNPRTNLQLARRSKLSQYSQAWLGLTAAQRSAWNEAAASGEWPQVNRLGKTYNPSGSQLFTKLSLNAKLVGGGPFTDPPLKLVLGDTFIDSFSGAAGTPALSLGYDGSIATDQPLCLYVTPQLSAGISRPGNSQYRFLNYQEGTSPINLLSAYTAVFGTLIAAKKIFVRAEIVTRDSGQRKLAGSLSAVIAA